MKKVFIKKIINKLHLLPLIEQIKFLIQKNKNRKLNDKFKKENPNVKLPPDFYMYETFTLNYEKFYTNGKHTAQWVLDYITEFIELEKRSILDWGCGTGRIVRHLPSFLPY